MVDQPGPLLTHLCLESEIWSSRTFSLVPRLKGRGLGTRLLEPCDELLQLCVLQGQQRTDVRNNDLGTIQIRVKKIPAHKTKQAILNSNKFKRIKTLLPAHL